MLPNLEVIITATTDQFDKAIDRTRGVLTKYEQAMKAAADRVEAFGDAATRLGNKMSIVSGAMVIGGSAMFALGKSAADAGNQIDKSSKAVGLNAEAFQELNFAIGQVSDMTGDQFTNSLRQMNTRLGQAADGSKPMVEAFEAIGISQEDIQSGLVDTESAFMALATAMQNTESPAAAAALAGRILGEEAAKLGPILRESGGDIDVLRQRAQELGIVLNQDAINASAQFTDKMDELQNQMTTLKNTVGAALLPVMISFVGSIQDNVVPALVSLGETAGKIVEWFGQLPGPVQEAAGLIAAALGVGGPVLLAIGAMSKAISALLVAGSGPIGLLIAAAALLTAAWMKWGDDIKALVSEVVDWFSTKFNELIAFFEGLPEKFAEFGRNIIQGLLNGINEQWEALKARIYELGELLPGWLRDRLGIASPSKVMHEIGTQIGQGLANGIFDTQSLAQQAIAGTSKQIENTALDAAGKVVGAMGQMFDQSKPIAVAQALINTWQGITEALKLPFPANLAAAAQVAAQGFAAVKGIQSTSKSGGGSASASASTAASAPALPTQTVAINLQGDTFSRSSVEGLLEQIQTQLDRGGRLVFS